jgi:serine/threonine protein kinase
MATVYLAGDVKHNRHVALKVLRPELAAAVGGERFLREIEIAAQIEHPHVLTLIDSGDADGILYYVMPFVKGESLRDRISREEKLPIVDTIRLLRDVADGLAEAHRQGLVHRDVKPDNVLISGRHAVVTDFGVAKAVTSATEAQALTTAGVSLGTPFYMSPEQAGAEPVDHRTDIYALGVMGYELLTGHPPFVGPSTQAVLIAQMTADPEPVTDHEVSCQEAGRPLENHGRGLATTRGDGDAERGRTVVARGSPTALAGERSTVSRAASLDCGTYRIGHRRLLRRTTTTCRFDSRVGGPAPARSGFGSIGRGLHHTSCG